MAPQRSLNLRALMRIRIPAIPMFASPVLRGLSRLVVLLVFGLLAHGLAAQLDVVMVYGTVKDMSSAKKLDGVTIVIFKNGSKLKEVQTNASGKYEVELDYGADYKVECLRSGYVGKNITIDTRNVPEEERLGGHGMNIDFTMMVEIPDVDYAILKEPFGMAKYEKASGNFEWDMEYTARMRNAQAKLLKDYEDRKKREANADAEYAKQMEQGEASMKAKDFVKAVESFNAALQAKPNDPVATAKLSDARMQQEAANAEQQRAEQFAALVKEADALFKKASYQEAKAKYDAASDINDRDPYPKQKIQEIEGILAEMARKEEEERRARELQAKYDAAITAADAAFKAEKWDEASSKYNEASGLKPEEKYPKDQLAEVARRKEEAAKKAEEERLAKELQAKYDAAISAADAAFKAGKWDEATAKYTEASSLKPEEKYPKDQLAEVARRKEEAERKAEEERLAKELKAQYDAAVAAADAAFKAERLDEAETKYTEAAGLKPDEKYPKDQLAAIGRKREELAQKAEEERRQRELDEQYQSLVAAADAAFQGERWEEATAKYTEAGGLKPAERYPKDQIAAIQKKLDDLARKAEEERKQRELDERYQAAITAADAAFAGTDWDNARAKYNEAAAIKPQEKYPKDQLAAITQRIAEEEERRRQEEIDQRYQGSIAEADAAFDREDYAAAKAKYQEASAVKPAERYPKDRIAESDRLAAEKARLAEEERKRQELEARYAELIAQADRAFDQQQWSAALNDYKDALKLKPDEAHPRTRIGEIEQQMDAAAQAKAEEERLERERQQREKRYADLVAAADKAFGAKDYDAAERSYRDALGVKADEPHPTSRLAEIERIRAELAQADEAARLAAQREAEERARREEEERLAAEREAAERARQAEADRLAAEAAAAERARLEEEERRKRESAEQTEARYRQLLAEGDAAFGEKDYARARDRYTGALGVKPDEQYPKDRLAAIDEAIAKEAADRDAAARMAEEQRRAEEERRRREAEEAEARRLAELDAAQRDEEERRRREAEEAEARRLAEEKARMERESAKAIEERYRAAIISADEALAAQELQQARGLYAQASDIKPGETYPKSKIDQIDRMQEELERQRLEAELAAEREARSRREDRPRQNSTIDIRKEQEAEQFMREAREREEAEKYERIKKLREELERDNLGMSESAADRRSQAREASAGLFAGDEGGRMRNADELEAYREALEEQEARRRAEAADVREDNYQQKIELQERAEARDRSWEERQEDRVRAMAERTEEVHDAERERTDAGRERTERNRNELTQVAQRTMTMEERGRALAEEKRRAVEEEKRAQQAREQRLVQMSRDARMQAQERLASTPVDQPRAPGDLNRSKLAQDYPPGVTEESYTEGNKVIIRRVVVNGDRADEYSKVIAKWGTFYFKNGQSITEAIWARETEG